MGAITTSEENQLVLVHKYEKKVIHFWWSISVLTATIIALLSYKLWGKPGDLQNLISIASGLVSISLGLVAIFITLSESIKTAVKESRLSETLNKMTLNMEKMDIIMKRIDQKTDEYYMLSKAYSEILQYNNGHTGKQLDLNSKDLDTQTELSVKDDSVEDVSSSVLSDPIDNGTKDGSPFEQSKSSDEGKDIHVVSEKVRICSKRNVERVFKGKVYYADLGSGVGSEQGGHRPVVIVSNEINNKFASTVTVVPITARIGRTKIPTHVDLGFALNPDRKSIALIEQIRTIDRNRLMDLVATLDETTIEKIDCAIEFQMGLGKYDICTNEICNNINND